MSNPISVMRSMPPALCRPMTHGYARSDSFVAHDIQIANWILNFSASGEVSQNLFRTKDFHCQIAWNLRWDCCMEITISILLSSEPPAISALPKFLPPVYFLRIFTFSTNGGLSQFSFQPATSFVPQILSGKISKVVSELSQPGN